MTERFASYRDVPVGAPEQEVPWIPMKPGEPMDPFAHVHCPACGGAMGFVAGGWSCLNPEGPLRKAVNDPFPRFVNGL